MALCLVFTSCDKDDDKPAPGVTGKYEVIMDGKNIAKGNDGDVGFLQGGEGGTWAASISKGEEISVLISSVPTQTGSSADIDGSDVTVTVSGSLAGGSFLTPVGTSGTVTRVSDTKITFICTCKDLADWIDGPTYSFEGTIESDAYKIMVK
ncbi:hypothetical protein [Marinifilum fragile]|uniref:hypothetical protein n=1 Tax=Marinifilum fragile TaxID=570161 RepID=UPI002AA88BCF|nr:hypothetical protein [Marinifilum fragile]